LSLASHAVMDKLSQIVRLRAHKELVFLASNVAFELRFVHAKSEALLQGFVGND